MGRRVLNRKEMRNDFDAAERRKEDEEHDEEDVEDEDDDEEEEGEESDEPASEDDEDEDEEAGEEGDDEDAPKKKKKKVKAPVKPKAKPRARSAKIVRKRVVWVVFNNSQQKVATYDYPKKAEAEAHAAKLMADKRSTHFVQPVKEDIVEEKKEK